MSFEIKNTIQLAHDTLNLTADIMKESFTRFTGTPETKKSAEYLLKELEKVSDEAKIEDFDIYPESFLGFLKIIPFTYIISLVLLNFDWIYIYFGLILLIFTTTMGITQFIFYKTWFDKLYKKKKGYNVYGVIEPENPELVEKQVIISGHHDSPHIFNFLEKHPILYGVHLILGLLPYFILFFYFISIVIIRDLSSINTILVVLAILSPFPIRLYFFCSPKISPGAGDNLIASCIAVTIGKIFGKNSNQRLKKTRLILLSADAEEIGLRGAFDFARRHKEECSKIPTKVIVIDGVYDYKEIKIFSRDINSLTKLSSDLGKELADAARSYGIKPIRTMMPFLGGATDAGAFAREGYEATSLLALETKAFRSETVYHTSRDTVDQIQPEAVEALLIMLYNYLINE